MTRAALLELANRAVERPDSVIAQDVAKLGEALAEDADCLDVVRGANERLRRENRALAATNEELRAELARAVAAKYEAERNLEALLAVTRRASS